MTKQYLFRIEILSKKDKNPLESIAYYSGEKQLDMHNAKSYETTTEEKVVWNKILTPDRNNEKEQYYHLPDYLKFRSQKADIISNARNILWQNVDKRETRPDSQFARLFELAVPHFLEHEEAIKLLTNFSTLLVNEGMIVDSSLHSHNLKQNHVSIWEKMRFIQKPKTEISDTNEKPQDYTAFLMCTLRDYQEGRFVNKNRNWNNPLKLKEWRRAWLNMLSEAIELANGVSSEDKDSWKVKLSMYPDYKKTLTKTMSM